MHTLRRTSSSCYKLRKLNIAARGSVCISNVSCDKVIRSPVGNIAIPNICLPEYLNANIGKYSKLTAVECAISGRKYTYDELGVKARNLGRALRKFLQLQKPDVVAVVMTNAPEYSIALLGCLNAGLVVTSINPAYTAEEISRQLVNTSSKAIITMNHLYDTVLEAMTLAKKNIPLLVVREKQSDDLPRGAMDLMSLAEQSLDMTDVAISPDDLAILPCSSGTTGLPKGVEITHRNLVASFTQMLHPEVQMYVPSTDDYREVLANVLPMFHIYGLGMALGAIRTGTKVVTLPHFTPELYISTLKNHRPTTQIVVPPLFLFLIEHPGVKREYFDNLRMLLCGAAPLGSTDEERFLEKFGKDTPMRQGYGLTETTGVLTTSQVGKRARGSVGSPIPNTELKVVCLEDPSKGLGPNQPGELLVRAPQVMKQYHNNREATDNTFVDGWLRTGDIAHYDEHDLIFITDRLKELIKVKAFQVPPAELEAIIRDFPNVSEAAVIGVPHRSYGEVPRAYVVPKNNTTLNLEELSEYVNEKVAEYKRLAGGIEVVDSIPKNPSGKILRRQLKLAYCKN